METSTKYYLRAGVYLGVAFAGVVGGVQVLERLQENPLHLNTLENIVDCSWRYGVILSGGGIVGSLYGLLNAVVEGNTKGNIS